MKPETELEYHPLSRKEAEMMRIFWDAGEPLSRAEILERAEEHPQSWKPNSVHILINQLMEKKYIVVSGFYLNSRKLGRTFQPALTPQEYALLRLCHDSKLAEEAGVSLSKQISALKASREK